MLCGSPVRLLIVAALGMVVAVASGLMVAPTSAAPGDVTTVAGTGVRGFSGDGGPAMAAQFDGAYGVALDGAGNLYIADRFNHRVRRVDTAGIISTVAGTGGAGFSGDGGPATGAQLNYPTGVAVDGAGGLYIADIFNHRIRRVDAEGIITTVAGTGVPDFSGDGASATAAQLMLPAGVALDGAGNLYIADMFNHRVRRVDATGIITTVVGTGVQGFSGDGGRATAAQLNVPLGIAFDGAGNLYIADRFNHRIRRVDATGIITTVAGTGLRGFSGDGGRATAAQLDVPYGVAVDSAGDLYIADIFNHRIRRVDAAGIITTVVGTGVAGFSGDGGPAVAAQIYLPVGVAFDGAGNFYVGDAGNNRVRRVETTGAPSPTPRLSPSVRGVGESPEAAGSPAAGPESSTGISRVLLTSLGGGLVMVTVAVWYARRRWLG